MSKIMPALPAAAAEAVTLCSDLHFQSVLVNINKNTKMLVVLVHTNGFNEEQFHDVDGIKWESAKTCSPFIYFLSFLIRWKVILVHNFYKCLL